MKDLVVTDLLTFDTEIALLIHPPIVPPPGGLWGN
jgi:hypothetical protein